MILDLTSLLSVCVRSVAVWLAIRWPAESKAAAERKGEHISK